MPPLMKLIDEDPVPATVNCPAVLRVSEVSDREAVKGKLNLNFYIFNFNNWGK